MKEIIEIANYKHKRIPQEIVDRIITMEWEWFNAKEINNATWINISSIRRLTKK